MSTISTSGISLWGQTRGGSPPGCGTTRTRCRSSISVSGPSTAAYHCSALGVAVHRMRKKFGQLLRDEIAQTVANPADIDGEVRYLLAALGG